MKKIVIGGCSQEISTFNPVSCQYEYFNFKYGNEIDVDSRGKNSAYAGAINELKKEFEEDLELIFTIDAEGGAAGPLDHQAFLKISKEFLDPIKKITGKIDAIYFSLHGAMGTTKENDPEGFLLEETRKIVGEEVPIIISLDLHGILTEKMLKNVNGVATYHTYPHVDFEETGKRAAKIITNIIKNGSKPVASRIKIPALVRGNELITESGIFGEQVRAAIELEKHPRVLSAGFHICNPFTDVPELCSQGYVFTDNDIPLAEESVKKLVGNFWDNRQKMQADLISVEDAVEEASKLKGPVAFTDAADAPSSGASGDSNEIIRFMIENNYPHSVLTSIVDPNAVSKAHELGVGETINIGLGGDLDKRFKPIIKDWKIKSISIQENLDMEKWKFILNPGKCAVFEHNNITVVAMTNSIMMVDRTIFFANGQNPKNFHSIIVKSPHCEPEFYDEWVEKNFNVDAIGSTSANLVTLGHTICDRPMYPMENDTEFNQTIEIYK